MQDQPIDPRPADPRLVERTILFELVRDDHERLWFRAELGRSISHVESPAISGALDLLKDNGVVCVSGELVCASRCVLHLHTLEVLTI